MQTNIPGRFCYRISFNGIATIHTFDSDDEALDYANGMSDSAALPLVEKYDNGGGWHAWDIRLERFVRDSHETYMGNPFIDAFHHGQLRKAPQIVCSNCRQPKEKGELGDVDGEMICETCLAKHGINFFRA